LEWQNVARISNPKLDAIYEMRRLLTRVEMELLEPEPDLRHVRKLAGQIRVLNAFHFLTRKPKP
jgi:hypothetical protein